jgi:hypothetical protein
MYVWQHIHEWIGHGSVDAPTLRHVEQQTVDNVRNAATCPSCSTPLRLETSEAHVDT